MRMVPILPSFVASVDEGKMPVIGPQLARSSVLENINLQLHRLGI
jgi:hypothetical protein